VPRPRFDGAIGLLRAYVEGLAVSPGQFLTRTSSSEPLAVTRARHFIESHATQKLKLRDVAKHAHVCPQYLSGLYKQTTGLGINTHLREIRLQRAKQLLLDPAKRISEVAFEAGFGSIPHFNRIFRKHTGLSPKAFRARLSKGELKTDSDPTSTA
jgi:AraC-like DNA-binding protein